MMLVGRGGGGHRAQSHSIGCIALRLQLIKEKLPINTIRVTSFMGFKCTY